MNPNDYDWTPSPILSLRGSSLNGLEVDNPIRIDSVSVKRATSTMNDFVIGYDPTKYDLSIEHVDETQSKIYLIKKEER